MEVKRTVPVKLDVPEERRDDLQQTIQQFNTAANYTIDHGRDEDGDLILDKSTIHDEVYHDLRDETDLPANLVVRAYSKAVEGPDGLGNGQLALNSGTLNVSDVSNVHSSLEFERESTDKPTASAVGR